MQKMAQVDAEVFDDLGQIVPPGISMLHDNMLIALRNAYPAWAESWFIRIDTRGGIVQVYNIWFSGRMGFVMHITKIDPEMRRVVKAAGELFERYGIARKKAIDIRQALSDIKRNPIQEAIYED